MHVSHQSTRSIARRIVIAAVAAAALSTPVVVEMSAHAAPERGTHAVAMPDCINNWSPICDRWDVPGHPTRAADLAAMPDGTVGMFDCLHHWAPICGMKH